MVDGHSKIPGYLPLMMVHSSSMLSQHRACAFQCNSMLIIVGRCCRDGSKRTAGRHSRRRDCHLMAPPVPLAGVSTGIIQGCRQHDSLANGRLGTQAVGTVQAVEALGPEAVPVPHPAPSRPPLPSNLSSLLLLSPSLPPSLLHPRFPPVYILLCPQLALLPVPHYFLSSLPQSFPHFRISVLASAGASFGTSAGASFLSSGECNSHQTAVQLLLIHLAQILFGWCPLGPCEAPALSGCGSGQRAGKADHDNYDAIYFGE